MSMKFFILLCAVVALTSADWAPRTREEFIKDRAACIKEENVSEAAMEKLNKFELSDEPEALCYVRCLGIKSGTWDDSNGFNVDRVYETFKAANMDVSKDDLRKCFNRIMDASTCVWAAYNMRCLWDNNYVKKNKPKA